MIDSIAKHILRSIESDSLLVYCCVNVSWEPQTGCMATLTGVGVRQTSTVGGSLILYTQRATRNCNQSFALFGLAAGDAFDLSYSDSLLVVIRTTQRSVSTECDCYTKRKMSLDNMRKLCCPPSTIPTVKRTAFPIQSPSPVFRAAAARTLGRKEEFMCDP